MKPPVVDGEHRFVRRMDRPAGRQQGGVALDWPSTARHGGAGDRYVKTLARISVQIRTRLYAASTG